MHFLIPMLLLPKTPSLTYPNMKRFKGPKMDSLSLSLHFSLHFTSLFTSSIINFCGVVLSYLAIDEHGGRRSIAGIAQHYTLKYSTCKTSAGANQGMPILKEIPFNLTFLHFQQKFNSASILQKKSF